MHRRNILFPEWASFFTKVLLFYLSFCFCVGCSGNATTYASGETQNQILVPAIPQRIVVFPLFAEEMLLEMIGSGRIVYVGHTYWENGEMHSPTMALTEHIPGSNWQHSDIEMILSLNPDLVVLPENLSIDYDFIFPELVQANITFLFLAPPKTIEDIKNTLMQLGEIVGAPEKATQMIQNMDIELAKIADIIGNIPDEQRVSAIYCDDEQSYEDVGDDYYFPNNFPLIARTAGVVNASGSDTYYEAISIERLIAWNPDLLTVVPVCYEDGGYIYDISDDFIHGKIALYMDNPALSAVTAIRNSNVHPLRLSDSQFIVQSVKDLAQLAYPNLFSDN